MAEYEEDDDELPSVDHGPLNVGPWEKPLHLQCHHNLIKTYPNVWPEFTILQT